MLNFFRNSPLPDSLRFSAPESFRLCTEGVRALEKYEHDPAPADLNYADDRLAQCVRKYPSDLLPKFYLGSVKILKGYDGLKEAESLLRDVIQQGNEDLAFSAKYNLAVANVEKYSDAGFAEAETILKELLADADAPKPSRARTLWAARATLLYIRADRIWSHRAKPDPSAVAAAPGLKKELDEFESSLDKSSQSKNQAILSDYWNARGTLNEFLALNMPETREKQDAAKAALDAFQKAVECKVDYVNSKSNLARLHQDVLGDLKTAREMWEQLLQIRPDGHYIHYNMAKIFEKQGDNKSARAHYRKAEAKIPEAADAVKRLDKQRQVQ